MVAWVYKSFGHVLFLLILPVLVMWAVMLRALGGYVEHQAALHEVELEAQDMREAYYGDGGDENLPEGTLVV